MHITRGTLSKGGAGTESPDVGRRMELTKQPNPPTSRVGVGTVMGTLLVLGDSGCPGTLAAWVHKQLTASSSLKIGS